MTTISFQVTWQDLPDGEGSGVPLAWGEAVLYVMNAPVWCQSVSPEIKPIAWSWIELLEFLASRWTSLLSEQTYPLGLTPKSPSSLRADVEKRWDLAQLDRQDLEEDLELVRFEGRHDLARGLRGIDLPSVLIVREGERAWLCTEQGDHYVEFAALVRDLGEIGQTIATHLEGCRDDRALAAVHKWNERETPDRKALIRLTTGLPSEMLESDTRYQSLQFWELEGKSGSDSELAAAARLLPGAHLSTIDIEAIFDEIRKLPRVTTARLDELSSDFADVMRGMDGEDPFKQGETVALKVRDALQLGDERIDPAEVLRSLKILVVRLALSEVIDAVGCWGPRHGPAVVLNTTGKRSKTAHGARATLAHELCHLLLDRSTALPMVEVLGGRAPYGPERRSNAFAAELLFPRWQARRIYKTAKTIEAALTVASEAFEVSRSLAAGQFLNGDRLGQLGLRAHEVSDLRKIVKSDTLGWDYDY